MIANIVKMSNSDGTTSLNVQTVEYAQATNFTALQIAGGSLGNAYCKGYNVCVSATVTTPSAGTFTAAVTDICTKVAHGMKTGLVVMVSNSGGALPTGLAAATDYYVIRIDADTFKLASSLNNANAGTAVDITGTGTGTQTVTPTSIASASYKLQKSSDGTNWFDISGATNNITVTAAFLHEVADPMYDYVRVVSAITSGQVSITATYTVKGS
jgi:hypothetical protein